MKKKKARWRPQLFDHSNVGSALRGIVESCPGVKLPARLLAEIGALDESGGSPNVARIIDEMMKFGLHSQSAMVSRDEVLFGVLERIGAFPRRRGSTLSSAIVPISRRAAAMAISSRCTPRGYLTSSMR